MIALLYVSKTCIDPQHLTETLDDILAASLSRNTMMNVTGLLIASPSYFTQILEGPPLEVARIMASITADPRHTAVKIVRETTIRRRSCPHWRMARFVGEHFGIAVLDPLLAAAHAGNDAQIVRLERLIEAITPEIRPNGKAVM